MNRLHATRELILIAGVAAGLHVLVAAAPSAPLTLEIADYVAMPITGLVDGKAQTDGLLARINTLREEPGGTNRFFVNDLRGPLYILDKTTKKLTTYLDFNGRDGRPGLFPKLSFEVGYGNGLVTIQFDPAYVQNGRFYTVHIEEPALPGSNHPDNTTFTGLNSAGYVTTAAISTPGPVQREGVLVEWTDTNIRNATFEGSARELLRLQLNTRIHPLGDLSFNPAARPGDADWRVLYIGVGDGGSGESSRPDTRPNPQSLDTLVGKILRIIPDPAEQASTSALSENGRYRIPHDNPFVAIAGARKEIWAYGLRNPHRLNWALDPAAPQNNRLITNSIGLRTWETVNIVRKGANYGYSLREGNELLEGTNRTAALPDVDRIPVQISASVSFGTMVPTYPVIQYGHVPGGGDAIGSGFLYTGRSMPALRGKYVFTDISTGRVWYANYADMLAADDGDAATMAAMHEVKLLWDDPSDSPDQGKQVYPTLFPIAQAAYRSRGGTDPDLPGRGNVSGTGRVDAHVAIDAAGELYIFSKTDGMIRKVVAAQQP